MPVAFAQEAQTNANTDSYHNVYIGAKINGEPVKNGSSEGQFTPDDFNFNDLQIEIYESANISYLHSQSSNTGKANEPAYKLFNSIVDKDIELKIIVDEKSIPKGYKLSDDNTYTFKLNGEDQTLYLAFEKVLAEKDSPDTTDPANTNDNHNNTSDNPKEAEQKPKDTCDDKRNASQYTTNIYVQTSEMKKSPQDISEDALVSKKADQSEKAAKSKQAEMHEGGVSSKASTLPKTSDVSRVWLASTALVGLACLGLRYYMRSLRAF